MKRIIANATIFRRGQFQRSDLLISDGVIAEIAPELSLSGALVSDFSNTVVFPGLADVHVHLREPGFLYKETIASGTLAAARGGFTAVCAMPNLDPVPDCPEHLAVELDAIRRDAAVRVYPYGAITVGEKSEVLADLEGMASDVVAFSDDGKGVKTPELMRQAMERARDLGKLIVAHCEDESLLGGGYIHDGEYARRHGHAGNPSASEWAQVQRDLVLVRETGCRYHVCHVSTKESVDLIRAAKAEGLDVSCETAPHYLLLCDEDLQEDGRFKMNPPLRGKEDREALIQGVLDGTVDMIATDHAPHSQMEKSGGLKGSLNGIVGLETAFPVLYTGLVKTGVLSLEKLLELMHDTPCRRFGIGGDLEIGAPADLTVFDLNREYTVDPDDFCSMGRATPFEGWQVFGRCLLTLCGGREVYSHLESE